MALNRSEPAARVYAEALVDIGEETGELGRIYDDLAALVALYRDNREFRGFFTSPRLDPEVKFRVLEKLVGEQVSGTVLGLLRVMVRKRRESLLDNIADQYARFRDLHEGRVHVFVETARALPEDLREEIRSTVAARTGKTVELHEQVEPRLIGGLVVRVGDQVVDGSLRRKIEHLRRELVSGDRLY